MAQARPSQHPAQLNKHHRAPPRKRGNDAPADRADRHEFIAHLQRLRVAEDDLPGCRAGKMSGRSPSRRTAARRLHTARMSSPARRTSSGAESEPTTSYAAHRSPTGCPGRASGSLATLDRAGPRVPARARCDTRRSPPRRRQRSRSKLRHCRWSKGVQRRPGCTAPVLRKDISDGLREAPVMAAEVLSGVLALSVLEIPRLVQDLCPTLARTRAVLAHVGNADE